MALYLFFTASPVVLAGALFTGLLGYEMVTDKIVMSDEFARSLIFMTATGALVVVFSTLVFAAVLFITRSIGSHST